MVMVIMIKIMIMQSGAPYIAQLYQLSNNISNILRYLY